jgi:limonene 1,2-monooxygenase
MKPARIRNGIFLAPFHPVDEDPTQALRRDLELVQFLDRIGYDEAWIGEHHSAGYEIIASPELFIAAAAEVTQRIRLGTGVISLPYHNPLMVADRMIQLDHQTRGRAMFGVGPGLLPSDAKMLGIEVARQRDMMAESLDVILRLLAGETVTERTSWYTLEQASCQLRPFTRPRPHIAVASTITPSGGRLAGRYGLGMLCVAATQVQGFDALGTNWAIACEIAAEQGREMDRDALRLVGPVHLAESKQRARDNLKFGLEKWLHYFASINPTGALGGGQGLDPASATLDQVIDGMLESGNAVIGTPDEAVAQLERLEKKSGGFGCFLQLAHNWSDFENTRHSYELFIRHVTPHFDQANARRRASLQSAQERGAQLMGEAMAAAQLMFEKHAREQAEKEQRSKRPGPVR